MTKCKNCGGNIPKEGWVLHDVVRFPMFYSGSGEANEDVPKKNGPRGGSNFVGVAIPEKTLWKEFRFCCKAPKK